MKTPLQELLERVQEYRDAETSPLVVSRLNSVCVDILGMLEKEKDVMIEFADSCFDEINDQGYRNVIEVIDEHYNKTFNTK